MPATTVKPLTLGLLHRTYTQAGEHRMVALVMAWFPLGEDHPALLVDNQAAPVGYAVLAALAPDTPLDSLYPKARGELLLATQACAPGGEPTAEMQVRVRLGDLDKTLRVLGDREAGHGLLGNQPGRPQPFTAMPLDWSRAYGGPAHPCNLAGKGYTGKRAVNAWPNVEYPGQPIKNGRQKHEPAGFGPRGIQCPDLQAHLGSMNREWLKRHAPHLAKDFSPAAFNVAPADQQLKAWFQGDEAYRLEGLHPGRPVLEGKLPGIRPRLLIQRQDQTPQEAEEVLTTPDTVWLMPHEALGLILYRAQIDCADSDGEDIAALLAGYEHAQAQPRPLDHYRDQLARRTTPETAALLLLNDGPLIPEPDARTVAARKQALAEAEEKDLAEKQALLDELDAEFWSGPGAELEQTLGKPEGHTPPKAEPSPLGPPITAEALRNGDIDLQAVIAKAEALAEDVKKQGEQRLADLEKRQKEGDLAEIMAGVEDATAPDEDIEAAAERARLNPPVAYAEALEQAKAQGGLSPEKEAELAQATEQMQAAQKQAKCMAADPLLPAVGAQVSAWLREQVLAWIAAGEPLAGRDLTGIDLHGLDLSGQDLSGCILERADLRDARLMAAKLVKTSLVAARMDRADLSGADLTGANLNKAEGKAANLSGATLDQATLMQTQLPQADLSHIRAHSLAAQQTDLSGACLDGAALEDTALHELTAPNSTWRGADLKACVLYGANLTEADFREAKIFRLIATGCKAPRSRWDGARIGKSLLNLADLREAVFRDARSLDGSWRNSHLQGSDWRGAGLVRGDFSEAHLQNAILTGAGFGKCLFARTELTDADAQGADFFQALLRKADLRRADLREANLVRALDEDARYEDADLRKARRTAMGEAA